MRKAIRANAKQQQWEKDLQYLRDNYRDLTNREMADKLGIKEGTVSGRLHNLGLRRGPNDEATIKSKMGGRPPSKEAQREGGLNKNRRSRKDLLEEVHTPPQLRQFYAKYLFGQKADYPIENVPWQIIAQAGLNPWVNETRPPKCLNEIVEELARSWSSFNRK